MNLTHQVQLEGTRFGTISYQEREIISFPRGIIGFENSRQFIFVSINEQGVFRWLQSLDEPTLAFLVTDPANFIEDYKPVPNAQDGNEQILLTTVSIPRGRPQDLTLNLAGPIVIDLSSKTGRQLVLEDDLYTTRYRVFAKASQKDSDLAA